MVIQPRRRWCLVKASSFIAEEMRPSNAPGRMVVRPGTWCRSLFRLDRWVFTRRHLFAASVREHMGREEAEVMSVRDRIDVRSTTGFRGQTDFTDSTSPDCSRSSEPPPFEDVGLISPVRSLRSGALAESVQRFVPEEPLSC